MYGLPLSLHGLSPSSPTRLSSDLFRARRAVGQRVDLGQARLQRFDALGVDLLRVHAGGPEVADQVPGAAGAVLGAGLLGQLALDRDRALVEHLERAPRRAVAWDRIRGEPLAVDVAAEVDAGVHAAVQVGEFEAVDRKSTRLNSSH